MVKRNISRWSVMVTVLAGLAAPRSVPARVTHADPLPLGLIGDLSFVDASHGWLLGLGLSVCKGLPCPVSVRRTMDGGRTWQRIAAPHAKPAEAGKTTGVLQLHFADRRDGWISSPSLWSTHDSGSHWQRGSPHGSVLDLATGRDDAWALEGKCENSQPCRVSLYRTPAALEAWRHISTLPVHMAGGQLTRWGGSRGWVLSTQAASEGASAQSVLLRTEDSGKSWTKLSDPCDGSGAFDDIMAAGSATTLWLVCGGEPGTGHQSKGVYRSTDAGRHWTLGASTHPRVGSIPRSGYVGGLGNIATSTANRPWLALGQGTLLASQDEGRIWPAAIPPARGDPSGSGVGPVRFVDARHGWLASFPDLLFRTTDGGVHWSRVSVS